MSRLFVDIETVPIARYLKDAPEGLQKLFMKRMASQLQDPEGSQDTVGLQYEQLWQQKAAFYAEFCKIVCISFAGIKEQEDGPILKVKSLVGNEREILHLFAGMLDKLNLKDSTLVGHNSKEFDFPLLIRRMIINFVPIPPILNVAGKKTWEMALEDTMVMWSGPAWNYKCSLELLAEVLGIPTPKADLHGSDVARVFFEDGAKGLERIRYYCQGDAITTANCYQRMKGQQIFQPEKIIFA